MANKVNPLVVERASKYLDIAFPIFFFLMAIAFYLRTYDSAQVKITILQVFGTILIALWFYKFFESGHWPFTQNQTLMILPILAMFCSGLISFTFSPLHWGSFDFFVRRVIYVGLALIAVTEITTLTDFRRITKWLVLAIAVSTIYGLIQWIDFNYFPVGPPVVGLDKFVWRRAFGERVFSTFGNPNFFSNFLVIMIPVMMALYFKSRQFYLLPLIFLTLANIYWTGSKGPMMGLLAGTVVFTFLFVRFFVKDRKVKMGFLGGSAVIVFSLGFYITYRIFIAHGGITSFTFRIYTWLSTLEMIRDNPVLGNGIGTFWVIYPAYRRPAIFHIEGKHNTETDHAENEHLEVWFDEGIVGMGLWIWLVLTIAVSVYKSLAILTAQPTRAGPAKGEQKFPEESYYMLGFVSGMLGMLIHNNTDVSMRFVSSGTPFWLLVGLNTALVCYSPLPEKQIVPSLPKVQFVPESGYYKEVVLKFLRVLVLLAVVLVAVRIIRIFDWCQGRDGFSNPNELPHVLVTWGIFLLCWGTFAWWFLRLTMVATRIKSLLTILIAMILIVPFFGFFMGDVNHNRAIFFSKQGIWNRSPEYDSKLTQFPREYQIMYSGGESGTIEKDSTMGKIVGFIFPDVFWRRYGIGGALEHYYEVHRLSPFFIMAHYFRGNVYNDWGSDYAGKTQQAFSKGDIVQGKIFLQETDNRWGKAMEAYNDTRRLGPNYVQMHHQVGTVHQKWGDFYMGLAPLAEKFGEKSIAENYRREARDHWLKALESYQLYYKIDPVFDQNYYRQAQVYIQLGQLDKAEQSYIDHIEAKECRKPYHYIFGGCVDESWGWKNNRYDLASPNHFHDRVINAKPEAWMYLGDFYMYVKNEPLKAEESYKHAVDCTPDEVFITGSQPHGKDTYYSCPDHPNFLKRLASAYVRNGKNQLAVATWQRVQKINPKDPDLLRLFQAQTPKK